MKSVKDSTETRDLYKKKKTVYGNEYLHLVKQQSCLFIKFPMEKIILSVIKITANTAYMDIQDRKEEAEVNQRTEVYCSCS